MLKAKWGSELLADVGENPPTTSYGDLMMPKTLEEVQSSKFIKFCCDILKKHVPGAAFDGEPFLIPSTGPFKGHLRYYAASCYYHTIYIAGKTAFVFNRDEGGMVPWIETKGTSIPDPDYYFCLVEISEQEMQELHASFANEIECEEVEPA